jgi:hypothetical protein
LCGPSHPRLCECGGRSGCRSAGLRQDQRALFSNRPGRTAAAGCSWDNIAVSCQATEREHFY